MKSYVIRDESLKAAAVGYLFYYERKRSFVIELCDDIDEWHTPLLFQRMVREGIYTIPEDISLMWVRERVIPSSRQNIGMILKNCGLHEYDEMTLLALSEGRCAQDDCYIETVKYNSIPEKIRARSACNISDCFVTRDNRLICMFFDDTVRWISLEELQEQCSGIENVLKNEQLLASLSIGCGGYRIVFGGAVAVAASFLREKGELLPLCASDFIDFIRSRIADTTTACDMLQCSRQNINYLVGSGRLTPVATLTKEKLYTKGSIDRL